MLNKIEKKFKKIVFSFRELFSPFFVVSLPEKLIRKCFGGKEKIMRAKKSNFKKKKV